MNQATVLDLPSQVVIPPEKFLEWESLWMPPERMTLSEWAERNFHLAPPSKVTGLIELYGWQKQIFDTFTDPEVRELTLMVSTQMIKTLLIQAATAYAIAVQPGPILIVQPKDDDARNFVKERIDPMIEVNPAVQSKMYSDKKKQAENTLTYKRFKGGLLAVAGAGSAGNLARREIMYLFCDEIDKEGFDPDLKEGDKIALAKARLSTYQSRAKTILTCSPTTQLGGRIHKAFARSDQRYLNVKCPHCGVPQVMAWQNVWWDKTAPLVDQPDTAIYICPHCERGWMDADRWRVCNAGVFMPTADSRGHAGFTISHLESPWHKLSDLVSKNLAAGDDPSQVRAFLNTELAKVYDDTVGEAPSWEVVYSRREPYPAGADAIVPARGLFLTCGVDVQNDWLEYEIVAWGFRGENWSIDHGKIRLYDEKTGAVIPTTDPRPWEKLDEVLDRKFDHENGHVMDIWLMAIDHGNIGKVVDGYVKRKPQPVFTGKRAKVGQPRTVVAVQGSTHGDLTMITSVSSDGSARNRGGVFIASIGTVLAKQELFESLRLARADGTDAVIPRYCHFPEAYDKEYFKGLCSEKRVYRGRRVQFIKEYERNEPLDCRVYARAAAEMCGMGRWSDEQWARLQEHMGPMEPTEEPETASEAPAKPQNAAPAPKIAPPAAQSTKRRVRFRFRG